MFLPHRFYYRNQPMKYSQKGFKMVDAYLIKHRSHVLYPTALIWIPEYINICWKRQSYSFQLA